MHSAAAPSVPLHLHLRSNVTWSAIKVAAEHACHTGFWTATGVTGEGDSKQPTATPQANFIWPFELLVRLFGVSAPNVQLAVAVLGGDCAPSPDQKKENLPTQVSDPCIQRLLLRVIDSLQRAGHVWIMWLRRRLKEGHTTSCWDTDIFCRGLHPTTATFVSLNPLRWRDDPMLPIKPTTYRTLFILFIFFTFSGTIHPTNRNNTHRLARSHMACGKIGKKKNKKKSQMDASFFSENMKHRSFCCLWNWIISKFHNAVFHL